MVTPTRDPGQPVSDVPALAEVRVGAVDAERTETGATVTYRLTDDPEVLCSAIDAAFDPEPTYSAEERHCRYRSPHVPHDADWNDGGRMVWHPCPGTPGEIKRRADRIERRFSRA